MVKEFKEKIITINFRKVFEKPATKRAKSALHVLKQGVRKETRQDNIKISNKVNEEIWQNGLFKCQRKITVKVVSEKDGVRVLLPSEKIVTIEKKEKKGLKERLEKQKENLEKKEEPEKNNVNETKKEEKIAKTKTN